LFFVFRALSALGWVLADIAAFAERRPLPGSLFLTNALGVRREARRLYRPF
jgi:hypothetical protein